MKNKLLSYKNFINDSLWSMAGLLLMNVMAQFAVYPLWAKVFGDEGYGNILYLISIINIVAVSGGCALNLSRMVASSKSATKNGNYNIILLCTNIVCIPVCIIVSLVSSVDMNVYDIILFWILMCLTLWRYYSDVEYRLSLNYKGYFFYYLWISLGYGFGLLLFHITKIWQLALIPGELLGILIVFFKGTTIRQGFLKLDKQLSVCVKSFLYLISAQLLSNLIFNSDRIVLKFLVSASAVSIYFIASLFGKTVSLLTMPLNSVVIGHISKYKGAFTKKTILKLLVLLLFSVFIIGIACTVASFIILRFLYPDEFDIVKRYFFIANLGQIFYFISGIFTTIILRFAEEKCQLYINIMYGITFVALVIPMSIWGNLYTFSLAILITNILRFAYAAGFAFYYAESSITEVKND